MSLWALVAILGCSAGAETQGPSSVGATTATGAGGETASSGGGGKSSGLGGGGAGGEGGGESGSLDVCVLNEGAPDDPCVQPEELDFAAVPAGTSEMRLFRIDNGSAADAVFSAVTPQDQGFTVKTVRYEVDPGDPNATIRIEQNLPANRPPGTSLYFEVSFVSDGVAGPLPVDLVHVAAVVTGESTQDITVPIVGTRDGCAAGTAACDADPDNGCETITDTDAANCGGCGSSCTVSNASAICSGGQCVIGTCDLPYADCDMSSANGCEANLLNGLDNCGACNFSCKAVNATTFCNGGNCDLIGCAAGFADCDLNALTGCETDILSSMSHCGGCNLPCALANAGEACTAGICVIGACDAGFSNCNGVSSDGCEIDLQNDVQNCGMCNKGCVFNNASAGCSNGACTLGACDAGYANCNGNNLDGCEAALGSDVQHCGSCATDCSVVFPHSNVTCGSGTCASLGCTAGYIDLNGNPADGCEYQCTFVSATDLPGDTVFTDENCDGVDGDVTKAVFVAPSGSDAAAGTIQAPMQTVTAAIAKALATGKAQVYVSDGIYNERVTLANGISLYGGYSKAAGWARSTSYIATIRNGTVSSGRVIAVDGSNITAATMVDRLSIQTLSTVTAGASSYAMYCSGCTGLTLRNSNLQAGSAGAGTAGTNGTQGASGTAGSPGSVGSCDTNTSGGAGGPGGTSSCGRSGGSGGKGGDYGANAGASGSSGVGGTSGGGPGSGGSTGGPGGNGTSGASGASGADGNAGSGGLVLGGYWGGFSGGAGAAGTPGNGAGGGGGGGGQGCFICDDGPGNGGGGGGAGGCGGTAATGGTSGGGSFGLFLVGCTGISLLNNTIVGGNGGAGGAAGVGGNGGTGGGVGFGAQVCTSEVGGGGNGGSGGAGGRGGHGGGGAGGISYGVYRSGTTVSVVGNTLGHGAGGAGGLSSGNAGVLGVSGDLF